MFFLKGRLDIFEKRKKQQEVWRYVRRIIDNTAPNLRNPEMERRAESRLNRCIPALIARWEGNEQIVDEPLYALTRDFSDSGISFVLHRPLNAETVVCGFWLDNPVFFAGLVRQEVPFGGLWLIGVQLAEVVPFSDARPLIPHMEDLRSSMATGVW